MNFIKKITFLIFRWPVIVITGKGSACAKEAIFKILGPNTLIFEGDKIDKLKFWLKKSRLPILVGTHVGEIPPDRDFFDGERKDALPIRKLARDLPDYGFLVLNFDDETVREIKNQSSAHCLTFGFQKQADLRATDINLNLEGTNFKINYQGNIVPFWLKRVFGKEQIYSVLAAIAVGIVKDVNLVDLSQGLKSYHSLPGKMRLVEGVKNTLILDDSENATILSMIEALGILKKLKEETQAQFWNKTGAGRGIAVLGDVLRIGKYTIEAHETIGEKAARTADLLFTFGSRAKFIAKGARNKGMPEKNIFEFDTIDSGKLELQKQIKKGDIILIDGSKEMRMSEVVREIKGQK